MKVKKQILLLFAGIIWLIAGFNISRIGVIAYQGCLRVTNFVISTLIFLVFWFMVFLKLVKKHTNRILTYKEEKQFFLKFFDVKSFFIMAFMMSFGIGIRVSHICPDLYIAVFYTGLGAALLMAGLLFIYHYLAQFTHTTIQEGN